MRRLFGWTGFILGAIVSFLLIMFLVRFLGTHYGSLNEFWFFAIVTCLFSTVVAVLAAGKAQTEDDERASRE